MFILTHRCTQFKKCAMRILCVLMTPRACITHEPGESSSLTFSFCHWAAENNRLSQGERTMGKRAGGQPVGLVESAAPKATSSYCVWWQQQVTRWTSPTGYLTGEPPVLQLFRSSKTWAPAKRNPSPPPHLAGGEFSFECVVSLFHLGRFPSVFFNCF